MLQVFRSCSHLWLCCSVRVHTAPVLYCVARCGNETCTNYSRCAFEPHISGRLVPVCSCEQCNAAARKRQTAVDSGPVCGSDGVTYKNRCELRRQSCLTRQYVVERHEGACAAPVPLLPVADCRRILCPRGLCLDGQCICAPSARCAAGASGPDERVCGSDGRWHANECALFNASCERRELIERRPPAQCAREAPAPPPAPATPADPNDLLDPFPYEDDVPIDYVNAGAGGDGERLAADEEATAAAACSACAAVGGTCREAAAAGAAPRCDCTRVMCAAAESVLYAEYSYCYE